MASQSRPFCIEDIESLQVIRQADKHRWLVCHEDSPQGLKSPAAPETDRRINRIIGVAALIYNDDGQVIVGKRMGSHGAGTWALPGGHIDDTHEINKEGRPWDVDVKNWTKRPAVDVESEAATCIREVEEETGLAIETSGKVVHATWDFFEGNRPGFEYYNTFFVLCRQSSTPRQVPVNKEPGKCEGWYPKTWEQLRKILEENPLIRDEGNLPAAAAAAGAKGRDELFLPLAKLVRDFDSLESLMAIDKRLSGS